MMILHSSMSQIQNATKKIIVFLLEYKQKGLIEVGDRYATDQFMETVKKCMAINNKVHELFNQGVRIQQTQMRFSNSQCISHKL